MLQQVILLVTGVTCTQY